MERVEEWHIKERKNSRKGMITSLVIHGLLLLLLIFLTTSLKQPDDQIQGVLIDFGNSTTGQGTNPLPKADEMAEDVAPAESTPPPAEAVEATTPSTPEVTEEVVTQDFEEAPVIESDQPTEAEIAAQQAAEQAAAEQAAQEAAEQAAAEAAAQAAAEAAAQAAAEQEFLDGLNNEWANSGGGDGGDGNNEPGGDFGDPDGIDGGGDGSGLGTDGIGHDLGGRKMVKQVQPDDNSQKTGRVAIKVTVDRTGKVISADFSSAGSNTTDTYLVRKAKEAAMKCKFDANPEAASEQIGRISFNFKVQ